MLDPSDKVLLTNQLNASYFLSIINFRATNLQGNVYFYINLTCQCTVTTFRTKSKIQPRENPYMQKSVLCMQFILKFN